MSIKAINDGMISLFRGRDSGVNGLTAFLPAALEIQETPPNPIAKWTSRCLIVLFVIALVWSYFGHVNVVSSAEGKIISSSKIKLVQPLEKSIVNKILVKDGQFVQEGTPLVELDATLTFADENRIRSEIDNSTAQLLISETLIKLLDTPLESYGSVQLETIDTLIPSGSLISKDATYRNLLWQQWKKYLSELNTLKSGLEKSNAGVEASKQTIIKLDKTLPLVSGRAHKMETLYKQGFTTEEDYLTLEQEKIQLEQDLAVEKERLKQHVATREETRHKIESLLADMKTAQFTNITELINKLKLLNEELTKASNLNSRKVLYAPVSGHVQQLAITTIGGVATEAQELMTIVPAGEQLEVEVKLNNQDVGFVREGMPAEIKIHTFPFTKYGVVEGEIANVSGDAILDENQGLVYAMRVKMNKEFLNVDGREVNLIPGMTVTAEVQTDQRRVIEFFLAPLVRYGKEGLRER